MVNYPYFELGTPRYLIVIVKVLSLGKMHINLVLFHFKKDHSLVIIQLSVPAIFHPIFSPTLNFCWHQRRGCLSAGCCCLLVFSSIRIIPITRGCGVFLPHYQAFTVPEVVGKSKAVQRLTLTFSRGNLAFSPHQPTLQGFPVLPDVPTGACCTTSPGSLCKDGMRAAGSWRQLEKGPPSPQY